VDTTERKVSLKSVQCEKNYILDVNLPYGVVVNECKALFDNSKKELCLTLPVLPPPAVIHIDANTDDIPIEKMQETEKIMEHEKELSVQKAPMETHEQETKTKSPQRPTTITPETIVVDPSKEEKEENPVASQTPLMTFTNSLLYDLDDI
jgi:hypothetical protein